MMPTGRPFTVRVDIPRMIPPLQSVGAHLAAKLQCFGTDERTLTDELCDMLCIWLTAISNPSIPGAFYLNLRKTTANEEVRTGADLKLIIRSPKGFKVCLIQAKVLDPVRC